MQDFTGVPAVVDLAAMRDATAKLGADPQKINPLVPVDLVIDHSVMVDSFGTPLSFQQNVELEYERNGERYEFLRWGQKAFDNFRVVPPGTGICHQVNLEYLAQTVWTRADEDTGEMYAYPDTLVGTDSHTTMVNGLARARLGRGRHRGRGGDARPADHHADPRSRRLQDDRQDQRGHHRHRPRAHRHRDAAQEGRGRQVRRVLRPGPRLPEPRGPGDHRQHGARIRRHLRLLPGRQRHPHLSRDLRPRRRPGGAGEGLFRGAGHVPRPPTRPTRCSPTRSSSTSPRVVPSLSGPKRPQDRVALVEAAPKFAEALKDLAGGRKDRTKLPESVGESRYVDEGATGVDDIPEEAAFPVRGQTTARRRPRGHRRDHLVHQHLEPERADRGGPPRPQGARQGPASRSPG